MKPDLIQRIEHLLGENVTLHPAPEYHSAASPFARLMAVKENRSKYLLDAQGQLIGLNLAATELDDVRWRKIVTLLEESGVQLRALNLCGNELRRFAPPPGIAAMSELDLDENPLEDPPPEIVKQGKDAALRFMQDAAAQGTREAFKVKMLIVGEGEAGKTTLWNLLQDPEHPVPDEQQKSTLGIHIHEGWEFEHLDRPGTPFLVNLWDFGGQEIQYMTHQFFLTRRSFYVLLANGRSESPNFPYWLNIINLLGRDQEETEKTRQKLPVLVVVNEKGNRNPVPPYDPAEVRRQYPALELKRVDVDFQEKGKRLEALNEEIRKMLCRDISHLPLRIPRSWDAVRTEIKALQQHPVNHISEAEFDAICVRHGIADADGQDILSRYLHELGFILHFHDLKLKNFVVLNPNWAVNAVYAILEDQGVKYFSKGSIYEKVLQDIWREKGFRADEQANLCNLMTKDGLEVCFAAKDSNGENIYIVPQLLPEEAPSDAAAHWWNCPETIRYI